MLIRKFIATFSMLMVATLGIMASANSTQSLTDSIPKSTDQARLAQIEKKITRSPHYKNPNAAGRLAVFNRNTPAAKPRKKERLTGPAYKNQQRVPSPLATLAKATNPRKRLIGPRYKNRSAKSHRSRQ